MDSTPASLLERLRGPADPRAWERFVLLYTPLLYVWARRLRLQESDAADLVQEVLTHLVQKLPHFQYDRDRGFRRWLRTVLNNRWRTRARRPDPARPGGADALDGVPAADDPDPLTDREYRDLVARRALRLMQAEFSEATWKACWEHVVAGRPAADVAAELGIAVGSVYVAKSRVLFRLREELRDLLD